MIFQNSKLQQKQLNNQVAKNGLKKLHKMKKTNFGPYINKLLKVILTKCLCRLQVSLIRAPQDFGVNIKEEVNSKHKRIMLS